MTDLNALTAYSNSRSKVPVKRTLIAGVDNIELDMGETWDWAVEEVRAFAVAITAREVAQQRAIDNPPIQMLVDDSLGKPIVSMRKTLTVLFEGSNDARPAMNALEAEVSAMKLVTFSGRPFNFTGRWVWISPKPSLVVRANSKGSRMPLALNDTLYYVPRPMGSSIAEALVATNAPKGIARRARDAASPLKSGRARKGKGVMALASAAANRTARGYGFSVKAGQSFAAARAEGRVPGKKNTISQYTGAPAFWQGLPFFSLRRSIR